MPMRESCLIDTHILLWLVDKPEMLSTVEKNTLTKCAEYNQIYIPAIVIWEIGMLVNKGRIKLSLPLTEWTNKALSRSGINYLPLSPDIAIESNLLPDHFHGDPADRIIIASARIHNIPLITRDKLIIKYAKEGHLKVLS